MRLSSWAWRWEWMTKTSHAHVFGISTCTSPSLNGRSRRAERHARFALIASAEGRFESP